MNYSIKVDGDIEFEVNSLYDEALRRVNDKRQAREKHYPSATKVPLGSAPPSIDGGGQ